MKKEDKELLATLGTLGALVFTGGVATAVIVAHKVPTVGNVAGGFVIGAVLTTLVLGAGLTMDV